MIELYIAWRNDIGMKNLFFLFAEVNIPLNKSNKLTYLTKLNTLHVTFDRHRSSYFSTEERIIILM